MPARTIESLHFLVASFVAFSEIIVKLRTRNLH